MKMTNPDSRLRIDGEAARARVALPHVWSGCVGAGRANEALRADWQRQFAEAVAALGFRYIRFHGLFHDDMFVYRESYGGGFGPNAPLAAPVYTFSYVDKVFDFLAGQRRPAVRRARLHAARAGDADRDRCSGGARTAARPRTWRAGSNW